MHAALNVTPAATAMLISIAVVPTATPRHVLQIAHIDRIARWQWRNGYGLYVFGHQHEDQTCNRERKNWQHSGSPFCFSRRPKSGQTLFENDRSKLLDLDPIP